MSSAMLRVLRAARAPKPMISHRAVSGSHCMERPSDQGVFCLLVQFLCPVCSDGLFLYWGGLLGFWGVGL